MTKARENPRFIEVVKGDITREDVDGIVNAANTRLQGGGGVDGAIHRAAGPALMAACRAIGGCETGDAVITPGYNLKAKHVIHTVGPIWQGGHAGEPELLERCYVRSLALAGENGLHSIAFPAISCGVYGYPLPQASAIAVRTASRVLHSDERSSVHCVRFVLFTDEVYDAFSDALDRAT